LVCVFGAGLLLCSVIWIDHRWVKDTRFCSEALCQVLNPKCNKVIYLSTELHFKKTTKEVTTSLIIHKEDGFALAPTKTKASYLRFSNKHFDLITQKTLKLLLD